MCAKSNNVTTKTILNCIFVSENTNKMNNTIVVNILYAYLSDFPVSAISLSSKSSDEYCYSVCLYSLIASVTLIT